MANKLKGLFIQDGEIKNRHLNTGAVDSRVLLNNSISTIHLKNGSITLDKFTPEIRDLLLPNRSVFLALSNATLPSADNPFVTREETFTYRTNWRDSVETVEDLPLLSSGINRENDIRLVSGERKLYVWQNNVWVPLENEDGTSTPSEAKSLSGVSTFLYDLTLGQGSSYSLIHDNDAEFNRIVQVKEKVLGTDEFQEIIAFTEEGDYLKTSLYSLNNTLVNKTSRQILGTNAIVWDPGVVGLQVEDIEGNNYRINSIIVQDISGLPHVISLETPILSQYEGNIYASNVIVNNNEASIIRQKNVDEVSLISDTSFSHEKADNVQVFSSKLTGITSIISIRTDGQVLLNYKMDGSETWNSYIISYKFGNLEFPIQAKVFDAKHVLTKPQSAEYITTSLNNIDGNDIFGMAYIEAGTNKPYFISWSHNFGDPVFFERILLDSQGENYEDISLDVKEVLATNDETFDITSENSKKFDSWYAIAISASVFDDDSEPNKLAIWINDDAGDNLLNWSTPISATQSMDLYAENPKVLISPQISGSTLYREDEYVWSSKNFSVWIIYRNRQDSSLRSLLLKNEIFEPASPRDTDHIFQAGRTGTILGDNTAGANNKKLNYFDSSNGYESHILFDSSSFRFKCDNKKDFDVAIYEDFVEPGVLYEDSGSTDQVNLRGTPVVVASNTLANDLGKSRELVVTYKTPNSTISDWSPVLETNKYGRNIKIKTESFNTRNVDNKTFSPGIYNSDNVHIFYINDEDGKLQVPSYIHNKYGTWESEQLNELVYTHRLKNFSDPLEYLDFVGVDDFEFDINDLGEVNFSGFYNTLDESLRGLYFVHQEYQCKFAVWGNNLGLTQSGPGPRSGFTYFHHENFIYVQGGYGMSGTIDSSMWRFNVNNNLWELLITDNAPPRVFHVSDIVKNVAYKGTLTDQTIFDFEDIVPTLASDGEAGDAFDSTQDIAWLRLDKFGARCGEVALGSAYTTSSYQAFFENADSIEPKDSFSNLPIRSGRVDVEDLTNKVQSTEGYRDNIIGFEIYNLTSGSHGVITDISAPINTGGDITCDDAYVAVQIDNLSGGSRTSIDQFRSGDQIVIAYPGRPAFDQIIMYGGGAFQSGSTNGFPDDLNSGPTNPPDTVAFGDTTNVGDNEVYRDARTIFTANIDERRSNNFKFTFVPTATNGAANAPVPCISGSLVITDYTVDSIGGISNFPNFVILNRSNAYRFKLSYEQDTEMTGRPFSFLGRWTQLDPIKANNGEPIEGITGWRGAKIHHYGGLKPAPKGHSTYPYEISPSVIFFGGFTRSDFDGYYSNSLMIINTFDVNLGWSVIESLTEQSPNSRAGNGIMVVNRQIEDIEDSSLPLESDGSTYINFNQVNDLNNEVWVSCGNDSDLSPLNYNRTASKDDVWGGRFQYTKRRINLGTLSSEIEFTSGAQPHQIDIDLKVNSGLNAFILPNGIRTNDNSLNSLDETISLSNTNLNDRYTNLSINDPSDDDYTTYNGSDTSAPNWIDPLTSDGDSRSSINGVYVPDSDDSPGQQTPLGERRWTMLSKLTITIPAGRGSGDHVVYVGVYNNGIKSFVELFMPNASLFSFNLAFLKISAGSYNDDSTDEEGKSWFDCGTGNLHLRIYNILNQPINILPYISKIENVKFVEITGVNWTDYSSESGLKPFKNSWGGLISNSQDHDSVAYYGGRTHGSTFVDNVLRWNPPSTFIQNEKSDLYFLSEIDGSEDDNWLPLRHGDIVKNGTTAKFAETLDHFVDAEEYYSAWGVAKIIIGGLDDDRTNEERKPVYYVGFNIRPSIRNNTSSNITLHEGLGFIEFEEIEYPIGIHNGLALTLPLFEGELNYKEGKLYINQIVDINDLYSYPGNCTITGTDTIQADIVPNWEDNDLVNKYVFIPTGYVNSGSYLITSNDDRTITVDGNPFLSLESDIPVYITNNVPGTSYDAGDDILFQILDINYYTYEGPYIPDYETDNFSGSILRTIGDRVGGDYSARIPSWVFTGDASIDTTGVSSVRDDRARTLEYSTSIYDSSKFIEITSGDVTSSTTFEVSDASYTTNEFAGMILYVPDRGYFEIVSNTSTIITITGSLGVNETDLEATIMDSYLLVSDILGPNGVIPNSSIRVPKWMINAMQKHNLLYSSTTTPLTSDLNDILNIVKDDPSNNTLGDPVRTFGRITFNKLKTNIATDPEIKYYQYFIQEDELSGFTITGADQIILSTDGVLSEYDATTDINSLDLIYVSSITETSSDYWELKFNLATGSGDSAILDGFEIEVDTLVYNTENLGETDMKIPTEVYNPSTYLEWQKTSIKVLFSFDNGITWKKYDEETDLWIAIDPEDVIEEGMEFSDLFNIVSWPWSGWNNSSRADVRDIPRPYFGFVEGVTESLKMFVGLETEEPAHTPAINGLVMNFFSGTFWEPKNFHQEGTIGNDERFIQVRMVSPTTTIVQNNHATSSRSRNLKASVMLNRNL